MPRDLFGDVVVRQPAVRSRRSPVLLASIAAHVLVLLGVLIASTLAPDLLPTPREALAFYEPARTVDIVLPPPPPRPQPRSVAPQQLPSVSPDAAPLVAPAIITPETGLESRARADIVPGLVGIESGTAGLDAVAGHAAMPPPPPPGPNPAVRLHSGITPPRKVFDVAPKYPELARAAHVEGIVIIEATIDLAGHVESARVLRSKEPLDQAALDAVLHWRFAPALLNGEPVPVVMTVTVNFKLQ